MTACNTTESGPLWLSIEGKILELGTQDLDGGNLETAIRKIAGELDEAGLNVSNHGGNMLHLRPGAAQPLRRCGALRSGRLRGTVLPAALAPRQSPLPGARIPR